jgi:hypothetical protein
VDPKLNVDFNLINRSQIASRGDTLLANNGSQANVSVRPPRVQFDRTVGDVAADGSRYLTVTLDLINPYADVKVGYRITSNATMAPMDASNSSGMVTIGRGQKSVVFELPALDVGTGQTDVRYVQLVQPVGALVGTPSVVALTPHPDSDRDGLLDEVEDENGDGDPTNDDLDGDGIPNYLDPDDDGDGIQTVNEDRNQNGNFMDDDNDGDGWLDYQDPANMNPCIPNPTATACVTNPDGDDLPTEIDPMPMDPCLPNPNALACPSGDTDADGAPNLSDIAPFDPCLPNSYNEICQPAMQRTYWLYLPLLIK